MQIFPVIFFTTIVHHGIRPVNIKKSLHALNHILSPRNYQTDTTWKNGRGREKEREFHITYYRLNSLIVITIISQREDIQNYPSRTKNKLINSNLQFCSQAKIQWPQSELIIQGLSLCPWCSTNYGPAWDSWEHNLMAFKPNLTILLSGSSVKRLEYELDVWRLIPRRSGDFYFHNPIQTRSGTHPALY
jgi:hypothetical protein